MLRMLVLIVIIAAITYGFYYFLRKKAPADNTKAAPAEKPDIVIEHLARLKDVNLRMRLESGFDANMLARAEAIIDKLWKVLPDINTTNPAAELTWVVNKISKEYLPDLMERYLKLDAKGRETTHPETMTALIALENEIDGIAQVAQEQDMVKLRSQANYLKNKFFKGEN